MSDQDLDLIRGVYLESSPYIVTYYDQHRGKQMTCLVAQDIEELKENFTRYVGKDCVVLDITCMHDVPQETWSALFAELDRLSPL